MIRPVRTVIGWSVSRQDRAVAALLAVAAYLPILLTSPGRVSADTKTYLTIDPGEVLRRATTMWDPSASARASLARTSATCSHSGRSTG